MYRYVGCSKSSVSLFEPISSKIVTIYQNVWILYFENGNKCFNVSVSIPQHVHDIPMTVEEFERKLDEQERSKYLKLLFNEELPNVKLTNDHLPKLNLDRFLSMDANTMQSFAFKRKMKIHKLSKHLILHSPVVENRSPSEKVCLVVYCHILSITL